MNRILLILILTVPWLHAQSPPETLTTANDPLHLAVGFFKTDITPDKSADMFGYPFKMRPGNDGALDPLHVRACALRSDGMPAVIVSFDLCVLPTEWALAFREKVAAALKIGKERVLIATTHTHAGPALTPDYLQSIGERALENARKAAVMTFPVTAWVREAPLGIGYKRRVLVDGKSRPCWNPEINTDLVPDPAPDPTLGLLAFRQINGPRQYFLWSLGVHSVTLGQGNRMISGDFPSVASTRIEAEFPDSHAMFLLGPAADVNPWISSQDTANVERISRAASSFIGVIQRGVRPIHGDRKPGLACAAKTVKIGSSQLEIAIWRLGDTWIAAAPVELFGELGASLRARLKAPVIWTTLTNGWQGYWPTKEAMKEGGYEPSATPAGFTPGDGEKLIDELEALATSIR
jgi:neutral ceramidase